MTDYLKSIEKFALANAFSHEGKAQAGSIIGKLIAEDESVKQKMKELAPQIGKVVAEINKLTLKQQEERLLKVYPEFFEKKVSEHEEKELDALPNAEKGKIVLRLAPYPSGPLHIGNAKTYLLNALYAEKYSGKLLFVMDDTIGSEEKSIAPDAYKLIPDGFKWLNVTWDGPIVYKSDRLAIYYKHAEEIIRKGFAYVCECAAEKLRECRAKGIECEHRRQSPKETLEKWQAMLRGKYKEGQAILRLKTSMAHPNPAFRDRVLCRVSDRKHPRVGNKYKVWPMLEFSWAIDDVLLGVTHVIRGKDLMMETEMCKFIWNIFGWRAPTIIHTGLIRLQGVKLSKSKAQKEVKSGAYSGWDDPRTWSLQSLARRGILPHAVREFIADIGLNANDIEVPIDNLYAINRKILDPASHRYSFIAEPVEVGVKGAPAIKEIEVKLHPDKETEMKKIKVGKTFYISKKDFTALKGKEVRLMHLYNIKLNPKAEFTSKENKEIPRITWVPADFSVATEVIMPDGAIVAGFAEKNCEKLKVGDIIQFERFGFVRLDAKAKGKLGFVFTHN
ncbi:MAG: glutamate--tRNA ligase [DPANN group archaeon]|nr:glutamate--tRNA ligase [DPANN group archaeon]